jgi:nucleotide-binding universal stress UspA family protein
MFKKLLIAVDDSDCSYQAAKVGFKLARELDAEVLLLYVIDEKYLIANPEFRTSYVDIYNLHLEQAENITKQLVNDLSEGYAKVTIETPRSNPSTSIIEWADTWGADLIVIGTHGKSELAKIFMGSTSQYIIRHSSVPCLVIREK